MKRLLAFGLSLGLVAAMALPAAAGVERNQIKTDTYTLSVNGGANPRSIIVTTNPCDGTSVFSYGGEFDYAPYYESIADAGFVNGSIFVDFDQATGYTWGGEFPVAGGAFSTWYGSGVRSADAVLVSTSTDYKNHGQYVKAMGGGADAAHSCIGMPVQARP